MMTYQLGIDVGTTRTAAAIGRSGGSAIEVVDLGDRASAVPSVLHLGDDGTVLVGDAAERRSVSSPDHVVREFKRRIGDPTPVVVGRRAWAPEELSAILVRWVIDRVAEREGAPPSRVAVAHPASWGAHKKERLAAALGAHGINPAFLAEPQAAALHYAAGERVEAGSTIAVYDLGGGTFDAAVVHKGTHGFGPLGRPEGIERLGGIDFDEIVFQHVLAALPEAFRGLDDTDPSVLSAVAGVRRECVEAKEALSSDTEVSIPVLTPAGQGAVRLHRSEFEAMIRPAVEETVGALRRAIVSAGCTPQQLAAVLLVGGSSRIPLVGQLVSEQLGRPVAVDADPKHAIAKGAALSLRPSATATASGSVRMPAQRDPRTAATPPMGNPPIGTPARGNPPIGTPARGNAPVGTPAMGNAAVGAAALSGTRGGPASERPTAYLGVPPPTQRIGGTGYGPAASAPMRPPAPERPTVDVPSASSPEFESPEPAPRRSPALLVGLGGALAAIAVLGTMLLLPRGDATSEGQPAAVVKELPSSAPAVASTTETTTEAEPTETQEPKPTTRRPTTTRPTTTTPPPTTTAPPTTTPELTTVPPSPALPPAGEVVAPPT